MPDTLAHRTPRLAETSSSGTGSIISSCVSTCAWLWSGRTTTPSREQRSSPCSKLRSSTHSTDPHTRRFGRVIRYSAFRGPGPERHHHQRVGNPARRTAAAARLGQFPATWHQLNAAAGAELEASLLPGYAVLEADFWAVEQPALQQQSQVDSTASSSSRASA